MHIAQRTGMPLLTPRPALPSNRFCSGIARRAACLCLAVALMNGAVSKAADNRSGGVVPAVPQLPRMLSLDEAVGIFRRQGLDLLIADANVRNAEGGILVASALPNPVLSGSAGYAITYANNSFSRSQCLQAGAQCSAWTNNLGVNDSAALESILSGKRDLRLKVARNALAAAKLSRVDAERSIAFQVKATYLQVAQAALGHEFARQVAASNAVTLKKFEARYSKGAINEGDLERIETQKLESDQALDAAMQALRVARAALAFLLGVRGQVPEFEVDTHVLDFSVPPSVENASEVGLLRNAFAVRPDLAALGFQRAAAEAQMQLTQRLKFPDIDLGVSYSFGGFGGQSTNGPVGPQVLAFSLSFPFPVFYQYEGELRQARAQRDAMALQEAKQTAQVASDVATGLAGVKAARALVERMEGPRREGGGLLGSAKGAFDVVAQQYEKGVASLTDYLDALRTYISTKMEYYGDLTNYWTAVFQLEAAVGKELN
jgi:cobalt-zinc-cadmium efflux system outer membrane protein